MLALTDIQVKELTRLKQYFPYRIVYGALDPNTNAFQSGAVTTKRIPNALARKGWTVWTT